MAGITWLHLSDWHQEGRDFDRQVVRDALIQDIREREKEISPDLAKIDFIVFSGDLAFSGKKEEYEAARKEFFDTVLEATGLGRHRLFIVPGNHDLDRERKDKYLPQELQRFPSTEGSIRAWMKSWLEDEEDRKCLLTPFAAYREFVTNYTGQKNPDYGSTQILNIDGKRIALLGLNSALMTWSKVSETDKEKADDRGKLIVGEYQIRPRLSEIKTCDVRLAVLHHPFDYLEESESKNINNLLREYFHFILCGHQHISDFNLVKGLTGKCIIIPAGASYESREHHNGYNFVHLDFENGQGKIYLRTWNKDLDTWHKTLYKNEGGSVDDTGKYEFTLNPDEFNPLTPLPKPSSQPTSIIHTYLDDHFEKLSKAILQGIVVPFLGAGINLCDRPEEQKNAKPSDWELEGPYPPTNLELAFYIDTLGLSPEISEDKPSYLKNVRCPLFPGSPLGGDFSSNEFPSECPLMTGHITHLDLQNVSQYVWSKVTETALNKIIASINCIHKQPYEPNSIHDFLVILVQEACPLDVDETKPGVDPYPLIVTTCFDQTLELVFQKAQQPFDLVYYTNSEQQFIYRTFDRKDGYEEMDWREKIEISEETKNIPLLKDRPVILRLYGSVEIDSDGENFAITEDHFLDYLACDITNKLPTKLWNKLINGYLWFLGYSLSYWNLRFIVRQILSQRRGKGIQNKKKWCAVQERPEILDRELWEKIGVDFFSKEIGSLEQYINGVDGQLKKQWAKLPQPSVRR
jgi:predicted phosphodiesterase